MRQNLQTVIQVAREYSEQLGPDKLIEMFATYNSWEGLFYYLGAILTQTEDKEVHFKYIEAAAKVGNLQEVVGDRPRPRRDSLTVPARPQGGLADGPLLDTRGLC